MSDCCCNSDNRAAEPSEEKGACCGGESAESARQGDSCCCGPDSSAAYSCADDPYAGHKKTAVIDFLFLDLTVCDRCQGADERVALAYERCKPILAACGYNLVLNQVDIEDEALAEHYRFYSSPTVRVNGVDICPSIEENDCGCCSDLSDSDVKCRVFPFNGTYYEVPPTDMLVRGIIETVIRGEKAHPEMEPYELPENLAGFFTGKRNKEAKRAAQEGQQPEGASGDSSAQA